MAGIVLCLGSNQIDTFNCICKDFHELKELSDSHSVAYDPVFISKYRRKKEI